MIISLLPTANFLDVQRVISDLEGFDYNIRTSVDMDGNVYVDGVRKEDVSRLTDFIFMRSKWIIGKISGDDGEVLA